MNIRLKQGEGPELGRNALDAMEERRVAPTAANYEIWLTHVLGENTALSAEIDSRDADGGEFDEETCARLHESHFGHKRLVDAVMGAGSAMSKELADVQRSLAEAGRNTEAYGAALEGASGKIGEADPAHLQSLVQVLMEATQHMRRHTKTLENKLAETSHEVSSLRTNLEVVRKQSMTDSLTGIANRKRLDEMLEKAVERAHRTGEPLSVAITDIDHFKRFNDTWGHQTGDQIIRFVAQSLVKTAADKGQAGRYGGEEFVVVLPGADLETAFEVAESARTMVEKKRLLRRSTNEDLGNVTISTGLAQLQPGEDARSIVSRADALLYQSKHDGRNRVTREDQAETEQAA